MQAVHGIEGSHWADQSTEHARGRERLRRITWTAVATLCLRGTALLSSFLCVPLTLHYLGAERYGMWVAISSVVLLLSFADCGAGYGLMNRVARGIGTGNNQLIQAAVSSTFFFLLALASILLLAFAAVFRVIPWQALFHAQTHLDGIAAGWAVAVIVVGFLLTLPFATVQRVQFAFQEGFQSQMWQVVGVLLSLAATVVVILSRGDLWALALALAVGPLAAVVLNWLAQFCYSRRWLRPHYAFFDLPLAKKILADGGFFMVLQVGATVVFSIDSFIILHLFGPKSLTEYNLAAKLFQLGPVLAGVWFAPLWPAYAEAVNRGDRGWVKQTLLSSLRSAVLGCAVLCLLLGVFIKRVILLWTAVAIHPDGWLLSGFIVYALTVTGTSAIATYLNGSDYIRGQALLVAAHALVSIALKLLFCRYLGIAGVIWGTNISYFVVIIPAYFLIVPRLLVQQARPEGADPRSLVDGMAPV